MIWIPEAARSSNALAAYIKAYLCDHGLTTDALEGYCLDALSEALSYYLETEEGDRAGFYIEDGQLLCLASKALRSVGETGAATRMMIFGAGFARPVSWYATSSGAGWTLDVARIVRDWETGLELMFFRCLHVALDALAEEWMAQSGDVVLALQGAVEAGATLLGRAPTSRQAQQFAGEIEQACRDRLLHLQALHGWRACPQLIRSDLGIPRPHRHGPHAKIRNRDS